MRFLFQIGGVTLAMIALAHAAAFWLGIKPPTIVQAYAVLALAFLVVLGTGMLIGYIAWLAIWERESSPAPRVLAAVRRYAGPHFLLQRIAPLLLTFAALGAFSSLKVLIPRVNPFGWDATFVMIDRVIFGTDPWRITHSLIGPHGTRIIDAVYGLWLPIFGCVVLFFSVFARAEMQRRFLLSFLTVWIALGLVAATLFSSAGPCFLDLIGRPDAVHYSGLFPLQNAPGAAFAQAYLAQGYVAGGSGFAKGISAMPSIHVAVAALYVAAARHYGRAAFLLAVLFYAFIALGSVHLGWHYAIDGIIGTLGSLAIWRLFAVRPVTRPLQATVALEKFPT